MPCNLLNITIYQLQTDFPIAADSFIINLYNTAPVLQTFLRKYRRFAPTVHRAYRTLLFCLLKKQLSCRRIYSLKVCEKCKLRFFRQQACQTDGKYHTQPQGQALP